MCAILLVDDEPLILAMLSRGLSNAGLEVYCAADGEAAWQTLRRVQVAVLVSDVQMPVMNGLQLLKKVRAELPALPVILMSGAGDPETVDEARRQGAADFLRKPMTCDVLVEATRRALAFSLLYGADASPSDAARVRP